MEEKELREMLELTRENNKILQGIQRSNRVGRLFRIVYWMFIIGSFVGTYYYLQPYIDQMLQLYTQIFATLKDNGLLK